MESYRDIILNMVLSVDPCGWYCVNEIVLAHAETGTISDTARDKETMRNGLHAAFMKLVSDGYMEFKKKQSQYNLGWKKKVYYFRFKEEFIIEDYTMKYPKWKLKETLT